MCENIFLFNFTILLVALIRTFYEYPFRFECLLIKLLISLWLKTFEKMLIYFYFITLFICFIAHYMMMIYVFRLEDWYNV